MQSRSRNIGSLFVTLGLCLALVITLVIAMNTATIVLAQPDAASTDTQPTSQDTTIPQEPIDAIGLTSHSTTIPEATSDATTEEDDTTTAGLRTSDAKGIQRFGGITSRITTQYERNEVFEDQLNAKAQLSPSFISEDASKQNGWSQSEESDICDITIDIISMRTRATIDRWDELEVLESTDQVYEENIKVDPLKGINLDYTASASLTGPGNPFSNLAATISFAPADPSTQTITGTVVFSGSSGISSYNGIDDITEVEVDYSGFGLGFYFPYAFPSRNGTFRMTYDVARTTTGSLDSTTTGNLHWIRGNPFDFECTWTDLSDSPPIVQLIGEKCSGEYQQLVKSGSSYYFSIWDILSHDLYPLEFSSSQPPTSANQLATFEFEIPCGAPPPPSQCPGWDQVNFTKESYPLIEGENPFYEKGLIEIVNNSAEDCTFDLDYNWEAPATATASDIQLYWNEGLAQGTHTIKPGESFKFWAQAMPDGVTGEAQPEIVVLELTAGDQQQSKQAQLLITDCSASTKFFVDRSENRGVATMGEYVAYRVDLGFPSQLPLETCKIDGDQKLTFNMWEDGSNPDTSERKDTLLNKTQPETLPVGGSATSIFEQMHSWDWTGQAENNCLESLASSTMLNAYLEAFKNIERLKAIANFVDSGLKVQEFYKIVTDPFGLILLTKYDVIYVVSAHDSFLSSRAEVPAALTVLVPDDQRTAWMNYQLEVLMAAMYGSVVSTVFSPIAGIGFVSGVMLNACVDFDYAVRYKVDSIAASSGAQDDGYKQVVEIIPISSPTINAQSDSTEKTIALAWLKATEYATAEKTSLERYEQAKLAVDQEWILKHLNAAIMFNEQYVQILEEISELTDGYIQELESEGFVLTEADLDAWQAKLRNEGLPEEQRTILQELGFDDADIDAYEGVAGEYVDVVPLEWQELTSMLLELSSDNAQTQGELLSGELCVLYDLNDDDYIDLEDINQVLFNSIFYGMPYDAQYDFVADGVIDIADVFDVVLEFGNACS